MRSKKIIVIFGIISILFLTCFLLIGNTTTSGSLVALDAPDIVTDINFDALKSSEGVNLEII